MNRTLRAVTTTQRENYRELGATQEGDYVHSMDRGGLSRTKSLWSRGGAMVFMPTGL